MISYSTFSDTPLADVFRRYVETREVVYSDTEGRIQFQSVHHTNTAPRFTNTDLFVCVFFLSTALAKML